MTQLLVVPASLPSHAIFFLVGVGLSYELKNMLWNDFLSPYFQFYEVTIFENTYAIDERKCKVYF